MGELQSGELGLARLLEGQRQLIEVPVVQRPMAVELERAQRVGDTLDRVALAVRPVVGGIDVPERARSMVVHPADAVHDGVTHLHVLVLHVDLRSQHRGTFAEFAGAHAPEQVEVLGDGPVTERTLDARIAVAAALRRDRLAVLFVDVGQSLVDQQFGPVVELLEVVARVERLAFDRKPEPGEIGDDAVDVARVLGVGVRVVEAQVADTAELLGDPEVDGDRLGVPDVQVAVRLGWEASLDAAPEGAAFVVGDDQLANEVGGRGEIVGSWHG